MATPNPNQPPPPPPCVGSKLNPAYIIPLPKRPATPVHIPLWEIARLDKYTGNRAASERLVRAVSVANPTRDAKWCADKAIHDLERDRH
ncbi:hypothetical protein ACQ4N7_01155 [Nodosilinea sp. AN01ver1]|uniref:hypothetical protein n=1 Tax=Nodosilinea sp. AN01ver1 TaxID=3423362 RepID=UPI003D31E79A